MKNIIDSNSSKANISEHIKHIFQSGELHKKSTVRKIRTVQSEGNREVVRELTHYNLDMIISIGYRVNSIRGTQFRIWANQILKDHLLKGYSLNNRMNRIEDNVQTLSEKMDTIDMLITTSLPPKQFALDLKKHNQQYPKVDAHEFQDAHDRFLIIDKKEVYHFGASLKDLGKKWFAFSKMDISSVKILDKMKCFAEFAIFLNLR